MCVCVSHRTSGILQHLGLKDFTSTHVHVSCHSNNSIQLTPDNVLDHWHRGFLWPLPPATTPCQGGRHVDWGAT